MVSSYLVHHGYSSTAETFAKITGQTYREELSSIKNRQSNIFFFCALIELNYFLNDKIFNLF